MKFNTLKIGPHFGTNGDGLGLWLSECPTVAKYNKIFPTDPTPTGTLVIGRAVNDAPDLYCGDPEIQAVEFYLDRMYSDIICNPHINVWQSWNERPVQSFSEAKWMASHLAKLAEMIAGDGKIPVLGGFSVGTPDIPYLSEFGPMLEAIEKYGGYYGRNSYGDLNDYFAFRHRLDYVEFEKLGYHPNMVILECGTDDTQPNGKYIGGWRKQFKCDFERFWNEWVLPFNDGILEDDFLIGAVIFTLGGFGWDDFQITGTPFISRLPQLRKQKLDHVFLPSLMK